jgi:hypothetical protein
LLEYSTAQVAKIRDFRLGLLHYSFLFGVVIYIVGWSFLYKQNYVVRETPVGSVRLRLMEPSLRTPAQQLPYCSQNSSKLLNTTFSNYPCVYWDAQFVVFPPTEDHDMFMTTRVTITNETLDNCSLLEYNCKYRQESPPETYFIPDIEKFTLMLDHTLVAPRSGVQKNAAQLQGVLFDYTGNEMHPPPPNVIGVMNQFDILQVGVLLEAAGLPSLDVPSDVRNSTKRYDGIVLLLTITYTNLWTYDLNNIRYEFRVTLVNNTKFRTEQVIQTKSIVSRQSWVRNGIRLIVLQVGTIGTFDIQETLVTIVSGMGLTAAATLCVDFLATKLVPQKKRYRKCIYQTTDRLGRYEENDEENKNKTLERGHIQNNSSTAGETTPLLVDSDTRNRNV